MTTANASFPVVLRQRIDGYFAEQRLSKRADGVMTVKIAGGFAASIATYAFLYAVELSEWQFLASYCVHGLTQIFLIMNIAHDSNHGSISENSASNKLLSYTFDLFGINSYIWRILHFGHHAGINIVGEDEDVLGRGLLRYTPEVPHKGHHRLQHYYAWVLYGFATLEYVLVKDFEYFFATNYGRLKNVRHPAIEIAKLLIGKSLYFVYMIALPVLVLQKPLWLVLVAFLVTHYILGMIAQFVFQLTHVTENSYFPAGNSQYENYTYHVLATTSDYATQSTMARWLLGGLNYHVAHHLFPNVCHTHYPQLTEIIKTTAAEFGVPYRDHATIWRAAQQHFFCLRRLGTQE